MVAFADLFTLPTRSQIKAGAIAIAQAAGLPVTSWVLGDPSERWIEISARMVDQFLSNPTTQAVRAFFFDLNTDPGDAGDLSADQTPRPGWLSAFGSGWWGVQRGGATYAAGFVTVTNAGSTPATFAPYDLTFQRSTAGPDGGTPTYRNTEDGAIYVGLGGTLTLAPSASATIPVIAEQQGTYANATPGQISVVVTGSFGTLTVTNANPVLGSDREERTTYITRSRQASAAASPNGPADAYRYASTTGADGNPLQLWDGSGATTVNRVFVSPDSSFGRVTIYLANPSGPATAVEVSSANGNINAIAIVASDGEVYNPDPIGVVPDTVTLAPTISDAKTGAPGPAAAIASNYGPLKGTARIRAVAGMASLDLIYDVQEAISAALSDHFSSPVTAPIGGLDQTAGAGFMYRSDMEGAIRNAYPVPVEGLPTTPSLYAVSLSVPGATTAVTLGSVPVLLGPPSISGAADNGGGNVRLTVSSSTSLTTGTQIQIYDAETTGGLELLGTWAVTNIDATHVDLVGSNFPGGATLVSARMSLIILTVVS